MSLTELILENPLIIVSMGAALLVFAVAGVLLLISVLRPLMAERQRQQALRREALLLAQAEEDEEDTLEDTMPAPPVTWNKTPLAQASAQASTEEAQASGESEEENEEEVSEEMQSILSSVFAEEGETHRYAVLLRDQDIPSGQELATLSQNLAARLAKTRGSRGKQKTS